MVADYLGQNGFAVDHAPDAHSGLARLQTQGVDLVILDLMLPDMDGLQVCQRIRALPGSMAQVPVLMLTAKGDPMDRIIGLEMGADDYVVKPYSLRELISRIRALLRRAYGDLAATDRPASLHIGELTINFEHLSASRSGTPIDLTPTEFRMLRTLIEHPNRPCSREMLIEAVWGYDSDIGSDRTVDVHMRHLRQKLEIDPANPRLLVTVRGAGYKYVPPD
jgi:DNA-binding response OmpR family regulator